MKRTPLEIKKHQFDKSLRGYDPDEVRSFLSTLSDEWEDLIAQNKDLKKETVRLAKELKHYKNVEEALQETLHTARMSAENKIADADKESDRIRTRADKEAAHIVQSAKNHRHEVEQEVLQLLDKREEMIQTLRTFLTQTSASLDDFGNQNPHLFADLTEENSSDGAESPPRNQPSDSEDDNIPGAENIDDILDQID